MKFDTLDEAILKACAGYARAITDLTFELKMPRAKVARRVAKLYAAGILRRGARYSWGYDYISMLPEHRAERAALDLKCRQEDGSVRTVLRAVGLYLPYPKREDYPDEWEFEQEQERVEQHNKNLCYHGQVRLTASQFLKVVDFLLRVRANNPNTSTEE